MAGDQRRALVIGVGTYQHPGIDNLMGPGADVLAITEVLSSHQDGSPNYHCRSLVDVMEDGAPITRAALRGAVQALFDDFKGEALFYFSGHGTLTATGGVLATCDAEPNDWGVAMDEVATLARNSDAADIVLVLDCCNSGALGQTPAIGHGGQGNPITALRENMTIIAASSARGTAVEAGGIGLFTAAVCDALSGGAADHMGWVSSSAMYAYVERRFGAWDQRPVFRTNATRVPTIRECAPLIDRLKLRQLTDIFATEDDRYQLDPEYEPEDEFGNRHEPVNSKKMAIALSLKEFRDAGLVKSSVQGEQFYWVARNSHSVELTDRGREYWRLRSTGRI